MARAATASTATSTATSVVARAATIKGRVTGDGNLRVEGSIEGEVSVRGHLAIAVSASITAEVVQATSATVEGALEADLVADEAVTLRAGARVRGAIRSNRVVVEEGATIAGRIETEFDLPAELVGKPGRP